jgi:acyl carrier protein
MSLETEILKMITDDFKKSAEEIKNAKKWSDLGLDSLDTVELVMKIEDTYDIHFEDDEAQSIKNLNDLISLIEAKRK